MLILKNELEAALAVQKKKNRKKDTLESSIYNIS